MKDRFKFKCWDKKINQMRYGDIQLAFNGRPFVLEDSSKGLTVADIDDIEILQCTGISDKNGKLIYEGDVLKNLLNGKKYKVAWVGCQASFELHQILSPNDEDYKKAQPIAIYFANGGFQRFQVLGNIYENPELLEEKCANQLNKE